MSRNIKDDERFVDTNPNPKYRPSVDHLVTQLRKHKALVNHPDAVEHVVGDLVYHFLYDEEKRPQGIFRLMSRLNGLWGMALGYSPSKLGGSLYDDLEAQFRSSAGTSFSAPKSFKEDDKTEIVSLRPGLIEAAGGEANVPRYLEMEKQQQAMDTGKPSQFMGRFDAEVLAPPVGFIDHLLVELETMENAGIRPTNQRELVAWNYVIKHIRGWVNEHTNVGWLGQVGSAKPRMNWANVPLKEGVEELIDDHLPGEVLVDGINCRCGKKWSPRHMRIQIWKRLAEFESESTGN